MDNKLSKRSLIGDDSFFEAKIKEDADTSASIDPDDVDTTFSSEELAALFVKGGLNEILIMPTVSGMLMLDDVAKSLILTLKKKIEIYDKDIKVISRNVFDSIINVIFSGKMNFKGNNYNVYCGDKADQQLEDNATNKQLIQAIKNVKGCYFLSSITVQDLANKIIGKKIPKITVDKIREYLEYNLIQISFLSRKIANLRGIGANTSKIKKIGILNPNRFDGKQIEPNGKDIWIAYVIYGTGDKKEITFNKIMKIGNDKNMDSRLEQFPPNELLNIQFASHATNATSGARNLVSRLIYYLIYKILEKAAIHMENDRVLTIKSKHIKKSLPIYYKDTNVTKKICKYVELSNVNKQIEQYRNQFDQLQGKKEEAEELTDIAKKSETLHEISEEGKKLLDKIKDLKQKKNIAKYEALNMDCVILNRETFTNICLVMLEYIQKELKTRKLHKGKLLKISTKSITSLRFFVETKLRTIIKNAKRISLNSGRNQVLPIDILLAMSYVQI